MYRHLQYLYLRCPLCSSSSRIYTRTLALITDNDFVALAETCQLSDLYVYVIENRNLYDQPKANNGSQTA